MGVANLIDAMMTKLESAVKDAEKFDAGNQTAGTRVRVAMQELKLDAQAVRVAVSAAKK